MAFIKVTSDQLQDLSGQVSSGSGSIQDTLSRLKGQIAPLASDWEGAASAQFQTLWTDWQNSAAGLQQALDGISKLLMAAAEAYAGAEQQIATQLRSF